MNKETAIETIWNYLQLTHTLEPADIMLVLGSNDIRVAAYAATLWPKHFTPLVIISGNGINHETDLLNNPFNGITEAEAFAKVMTHAGVPEDTILLEPTANHTGENFSGTKVLLKEKHISLSSAVVVTKTPMSRRAYATGKAQWPDVELMMTTPPLTFAEYLTNTITADDTINIMLGDLERIKEYPARGFQISQDIPNEVWSAFLFLKDLGYTKHLLNC